jgi:alpha-tubulin suppressor-like RCC1 family protein
MISLERAGRGGETSPEAQADVRVSAIGLVSVTALASDSCGISEDGWGANDFGQSGLVASLYPCPGEACRRAPSLVPHATSLTALTLGFLQSCGVGQVGRAYCWGLNNRAQLGNNAASFASEPVDVVGGLEFTSVTSGEFHTCALAPDGAPYCWGTGITNLNSNIDSEIYY